MDVTCPGKKRLASFKNVATRERNGEPLREI